MLDYPQTEIRKIGRGKDSVIETLKVMRELVDNGVKDWKVRWAAINLVKTLPQRDWAQEVNAIYLFLQNYMRYTHDTFHLELVHTPQFLLESIMEEGIVLGDCDDYSILGASLLRVLGYNVQFKVIACYPSESFSHVYLVVKLNGEWVPFDAIHQDWKLGQEASGISRTLFMEVR